MLTFHHNPPTTINICCLRRAPGKAAVVAVDVGSSLHCICRDQIETADLANAQLEAKRTQSSPASALASAQPTAYHVAQSKRHLNWLCLRDTCDLFNLQAISTAFTFCPDLASQSTPCVVYFASTASDGGESSS